MGTLKLLVLAPACFDGPDVGLKFLQGLLVFFAVLSVLFPLLNEQRNKDG
jgi:hypothetical protein